MIQHSIYIASSKGEGKISSLFLIEFSLCSFQYCKSFRVFSLDLFGFAAFAMEGYSHEDLPKSVLPFS